jgi:uncharacterized protein (DUF1778 family)
MNDESLKQLQDDDEWDFESAQTQQPAPNRRAVVSVSFRPDDFTLVAEAARRNNQLISQFIREAALIRVRETNERDARLH